MGLNQDNSILSNAIKVSSTYNVGIGTSSPNVSSQGSNNTLMTIQGQSGNYGMLEIGATTNTAESLIGVLGFTSTTVTGGLLGFISMASEGTTGTNVGARIQFNVKSNGGSISERMRITNAGNVGIGTTSPNSILEIKGSTTTNSIRIGSPTGSDTYNLISLNGNSAEGQYLGLAGGGGTDTSLYLNSGNAGSLIFRTGNGTAFTERMRVTSGGNVGIGTSSPQNSLVVSSGGAEGVEIYANSNGGNIFAYNRSTSAYKNLILAAGGGNVGIGTIAPDSYANKTLQLHNASTGSTYFKISNSTTGSGQGNGLDIGEINSDTYIWNRENGFMSLGTNGSERMRITNAGDLAINSTSASAQLYVKTPSGQYTKLIARFDNGDATPCFTVDGQGNVRTIYIGSNTGTSVVLDSNGYLRQNSSSIRYKKDIEPIDIGLDFVNSLNPVKYNLKSNGEAQIGFIAEDFPDERLVSFSRIDMENENSILQRESVNYSNLTAALVKAIQELKAEIDILKQQ